MKVPCEAIDVPTIEVDDFHRRKGTYHWSLTCCLLTLILLGGWFLHSILTRPHRTPILTLTSIYGPQWDLNAWVGEDLDAIESLGKGTFSVSPLSSIDRLADGFWDEADASLRTAAGNCSDGVPLTIYVNLHGAVNDQEQACWIPTSGTAADASTWFPIEDLLDHIGQMQASTDNYPILMLLECGKLRSHWPSGIADNAFDDRLGDLVSQHYQKYPNSSLTILSATSWRQRSQNSQDGRGDVFTWFVTEALAGHADGYSDAGVVDGWIESDELFAYVRSKVQTWSLRHRGELQTPTMHRCGDEGSIRIACVGRSRDVRTATPGELDRATIDRLHQAYGSIDELRLRHAASLDTYGWVKLQRTIRAIEHSVHGGRAAQAKLDALFSRFDYQLKDLHRQLSNRETISDHVVDLHLDRKANAIWSAIAQQPQRDIAKEWVDRATNEAAQNGTLVPTPMLVAFLNCPDAVFWRQTELIKRTAAAQAAWLNSMTTVPDAAFPTVSELSKSVHEKRLVLADIVLSERITDRAESPASPSKTLEHAVDNFVDQVRTSTTMLSHLVDAWHVRDQAFAELAITYSSSDPRTNEFANGFNSLIQLDTALRNLTNICETKGSVSDTDGLVIEIHKQAGKVAQFLKMEAADRDESNFANLLRKKDEALNRTSITDEERQSLASQIASFDEPRASSTKILETLVQSDQPSPTPAILRAALQGLSNPPESVPGLGRNWRRTVSLICDDRFAANLSTVNLQARQTRLALRARQCIDDFWCAPIIDTVPYFADAAGRMLDACGTDKGVSKSDPRFIVAQHLERSVAAASRGIALSANVSSEYGTASPSLRQLSVQRTGVASDLPPGMARLSLLATQDEPIDVFQRVPIGNDMLESGQSFAEFHDLRESVSLAKLEFRGHVLASAHVSTSSVHGVSSRDSKSDGHARVTLSNSIDLQRSICFVLDCSASMNDAINSEVARGEFEPSSAIKLDAARSALFEMLRRIEPDETEVGLVLYGHRMAIGTGDQGLLLQKRYHKQFPFASTIEPYQDVEVALPCGRFGTAELEIARQRLDATVPWGQTPLFLAISQGIDDLTKTDRAKQMPSESMKDVIVISDGRNYQFNPTADAVVSLQALVSKAKKHDVKVHLIGFGLTQSETAETVAQFRVIAEGTGGKAYGDVYEATKLLDQLQSLSSPREYSIQTTSGESQTAKIGETISLSSVHDVNSPLTISIDNQTQQVPISPGNDLRLVTDPTDGVPKAVAYRRGMPTFAALTSPAGHRVPARLAVHQPVLQGNDLQFQLSMQRVDSRVLDRPALVWIETRAIASNSQRAESRTESPKYADPCYRTSAVTWKDGSTCPVAEYVCQQWPSDCQQYSVQAWCLPSLPAAATVELSLEPTPLQPLENFPGIRYSIEPLSNGMQLRLQYNDFSEGQTDDHMLIVRLADHENVNTTQWYDSAQRISVHSFEQITAASSHQVEPTLARTGSLKLWFCKIGEAKSHAVRNESPVVDSLYRTIASVPATVNRTTRESVKNQ